MNHRSGLSFADVLILLAVVLLLAALAVPRFIKAPDYGSETDELVASDTNKVDSADATNHTEEAGLRKDTNSHPLP